MSGGHDGVVARVRSWLEAGHPVWLSTVIRTHGSAPRPVGSLMAVCPGQGVIGSVSGGCIEEALFEDLESGRLLARQQHTPGPWRLRYGHSEEDQQRFALPCGGQIHLLLEYLRPEAAVLGHMQTLDDAIQERRAVTRRVDLASGALAVMDGVDEARHPRFDGAYFLHPLTAGERLLLVGAGEVARQVAPLAAAVDFQVTLCDPRADYLRRYPIPGVPTLNANPDDVVRQHFHDPDSAVLTLSHDPRVDDLALIEALQTEAFFVGAMGSERTSQARRERLRELGLSEAAVGRLQAPVGLPIGSKTPAEIALSAVSQLVAWRHRRGQARPSARTAPGYQDACPAEALR